MCVWGGVGGWGGGGGGGVGGGRGSGPIPRLSVLPQYKTHRYIPVCLLEMNISL